MAMPAPTTISANTLADATVVHGNFQAIRTYYNNNAVELSGAQSIAGAKTFSDTAVLGAGATVTGDLTGATTISATTLAGTLSTAAQTAITSVGTLSSLAVSGATTFNTVAYTWPGSSSNGLLKNTSGTLSWDTAVYLSGAQAAGSVPRATGTGTLAAGAMTDNGAVVGNISQPMVRALTTTYSLSGSSSGKVTFTSADINTQSNWAGGNPTRLTVTNGNGGLWLVTWAVVSGVGTPNASATLYKNNSAVSAATSIKSPTLSVTGVYADQPSLNDYYELHITNSDTGSYSATITMTAVKLW